MYEFVIDPSLYSSPETYHKDFVNYLWNKNLILDVYDSRTHFYLGQLNFGLRDVLRGKKEKVISIKEHMLVSGEGKPICNLHLMVTNEAVACKKDRGISNSNNPSIPTQLASNFNRILSTAPMILPASTLPSPLLPGALQ